MLKAKHWYGHALEELKLLIQFKTTETYKTIGFTKGLGRVVNSIFLRITACTSY
eukprot:m.109203 g.109203  ORF g.109203 m.109203 type:complete len:54 (+) comp15238_c0_seq4:1954-2115(+)